MIERRTLITPFLDRETTTQYAKPVQFQKSSGIHDRHPQ
jgi:hypothetical protein